MKTLVTLVLILAAMVATTPVMASRKEYTLLPVEVIEIEASKMIWRGDGPACPEFLAAKMQEKSVKTKRFMVAVSGFQFVNVRETQARVENGPYRTSSKELAEDCGMIGPTKVWNAVITSTCKAGGKSIGFSTDGGLNNSRNQYGNNGRNNSRNQSSDWMAPGVVGQSGQSSSKNGYRSSGNQDWMAPGVVGGSGSKNSYGRNNDRKETAFAIDTAKLTAEVKIVSTPTGVRSGLVKDAYVGIGKATINDIALGVSVNGISASYASAEQVTEALWQAAASRAIDNLFHNMLACMDQVKPVTAIYVDSGVSLVEEETKIDFFRNDVLSASYEVLGINKEDVYVRQLWLPKGTKFMAPQDGDMFNICPNI